MTRTLLSLTQSCVCCGILRPAIHLHGLAKKAKDGRDGTKYGALDVSRSFMEFHAGAISTAVVKAEACMLERGAAALEARLVRASPDGGPMVAAAGRA